MEIGNLIILGDLTRTSSNGVVMVGASVHRLSFTNADLSNGVVNVAHEIGQQFVQATVYDDVNSAVLPDNIICNANSVAIDISSFGTINGTWTAVLVG